MMVRRLFIIRLAHLFLVCHAAEMTDTGSESTIGSRTRQLATINGYFWTRNRTYIRTRNRGTPRKQQKPRRPDFRKHSSLSGCRSSGKASKKRTNFLDTVDGMRPETDKDCSSSKVKSGKKKKKRDKGKKKKKCKESRGKGKGKKSKSNSSKSSSGSSSSGIKRRSSKICDTTEFPVPFLTAGPVATTMAVRITNAPISTTNAPVIQSTASPVKATIAPSMAPSTRQIEPILPTLQPTIVPTGTPPTIPPTTLDPTAIPQMEPTVLPTQAPTTLAPTPLPITAPITLPPTPASTQVPTTMSPTPVPIAAPTTQPTAVPTTGSTALPTQVPMTLTPTPAPTTAATTVAPTTLAPTVAPSPPSDTMRPTGESNVSPFRLDYFVNNANPADYDEIQELTRDYLDQFLLDQFRLNLLFMYDGLTMVATDTMSDPGVFMANFESVQVDFSSSVQPSQSDLDVLVATAFTSPAVDDLLASLQSSGTSFSGITDVAYVRL